MMRFALAGALLAQLAAGAAPPAWVSRSNEHAKVALATIAEFSPESAGGLGLEGHDERIFDLRPQSYERFLQANRKVLAELEKRRNTERDPLVRQDIDITIDAVKESIEGAELGRKYRLPYYNMGQVVFGGIRSLLDDQVAAGRRPAAVTRLKRYAGLDEGYTPVTKLAEDRIRERLAVPGLIGPPRDQVEKDLKNSSFFIDGLGPLFIKYKLTGHEEALAKLKAQLATYNEFVRTEVLPRSREDFRLPPELYAFSLRSFGIDIPPAELAAMAHTAFDSIQKEMDAVAAKVAKDRKLAVSGYRNVIRELKKEQLAGDSIVTHYRERIGQIEEIIRRENLVSLPERPARMRLASPAESAGQPAPNMRPPRLIGNTGESGEFVLPLANPSAAAGSRMDDFTFAAASWTLTAHEARPGHEMQFSAMVEQGVSNARAIFAFNSTNVEGWGLYSEHILFPFMPPEGQLISLQHRLMRAGRAFLDPELQSGKVTLAEAKQILMNDVLLSEPMATQEIDRYAFRAPGQATSYFYGYTKLLALRQDVERKTGAKFKAREFHDFILSQGLLPPAMLRAAVEQKFLR
ncbi:MAG TPA: DUF885 domain-containing protein [Bryobacteraceae bacterium]|nr:DUF885 domain-containing protein [Bryobacteraceae bacterium]